MGYNLSINLAIAVFFGVLMQWLAQKYRVPALLLLILTGAVLGESHFHLISSSVVAPAVGPLVSMSVALILFEGGLSLRLKDAAHAPKAVLSLVTTGALTSTVLTAFAAHYLLDVEWTLALLLGCILMVTGPTVVLPILRRVRLSPTLHSVLQWEGILIDPIGALAAIVALEILMYAHGAESSSPILILGAFPLRLFVGAVIGGAGGFVLSRVLSNPRLAPSKEEDMNNLLGLGGAMGLFAVSNALMPESGLAAVTVAGMTLGNLGAPGLEQLRVFKGQITLILIGTLFIVLAAPIDLHNMLLRSGSTHAFTALLVLVVRPAAVFVATNRTRMALRERLFAAFFAPRGIVAAGVAGLFGRAISAAGVPGAELVMNVTYEVILVTVALAAVGASPMARILRVSAPAKQGVLIVGCHQFGRSLGSALRAAGVPVMLVDTNPSNCRRAQRLELPSVCGSATDERVLEDLDFPEMGTILALTTNEEVNTLVCEWGKEAVGPRSTYQARLETSDSLSAASRAGLGGLTAFAQKLPLNAISAALAENRAEILTAQAQLSDLMTGDEMSQGLDLGDYLLGWIVKGSFKVHTPDAKPEPQGAALYLRVASTA